MANHPIQKINNIKELLEVNYRNSIPISISIIDTTTNIEIAHNDRYAPSFKKLFKDIVSKRQRRYNNTLTQREIMNITNFNCHTNGNLTESRGYHYVASLDLYIQSKDANGTMKEIIRLADRYQYKLHLVIKLQDGTIIKH